MPDSQGPVDPGTDAPAPTARLRLRRYRAEDEGDFVWLNADPEVRRHIGGPMTPAHARARFVSLVSGCAHGWAIERRDGHPDDATAPRLVGHAWLTEPDADRDGRREVGVLLARAHWGQGLGGEAAHSVAEHARTAFGVPVVYATVDADHGRSIGMLGRAGFRHVGTEVDDEGPYEVFAYGVDLAAGAAASQTAAGR